MSDKNKKIRHNKIKNTGILFELLTRKFTSDIINGTQVSIAQRLIEKYFKNTSELGKEYVLYQALIKQRFNSSDKAKEFLNEVISAHKKLRHGSINESKYSLIRDINENFDVYDFFNPKIENYKLLASIYKTFQSKSLDENIDPADVVNSKFVILENILGKTVQKSDDFSEETLSEYLNQPEDIRLLSYKFLVEKFNEKYSILDKNQKILMREYINNMSSVNSLTSYIQAEIPNIQHKLQDYTQKMSDTVLKIKLNEVSNQLEIIKNLKVYNDSHITALLQSYELIKELGETD